MTTTPPVTPSALRMRRLRENDGRRRALRLALAAACILGGYSTTSSLKASEAETGGKAFRGKCVYGPMNRGELEVRIPCKGVEISAIGQGRVAITFLKTPRLATISFAGPADLKGDNPSFPVDAIEKDDGSSEIIQNGKCQIFSRNSSIRGVICRATSQGVVYLAHYLPG